MVWDEKEKVSRRAMHEAIFEAGWKHEKMRSQHRRVISPIHQGKGREIIALDWTFSYHPYIVASRFIYLGYPQTPIWGQI